jgi:hypothetical protein
MSEPDGFPGQIRKAVAARDYARALGLWTRYAALLEEQARAHTLQPASMTEAAELLEWVRLNLLAARAHDQDQLQQLRVGSAYRPKAPNRPSRLCTDL